MSQPIADPAAVMAGLVKQTNALLWRAEATQMNYEIERTLAEYRAAFHLADTDQAGDLADAEVARMHEADEYDDAAGW
jgi:hypothetical protein